MSLLHRNAKAEMICYFAGCLLVVENLFLKEKHLQSFFTALKNFLTHDRVSDMSSFFAISIGIYIAIITIIATSVIGISRRMLEKNRHKDLLCVISFGLIENLLAVVVGILLNGNSNTLNCAFLTITIASIISFGKFTYLMILVFSANMEQMVLDIDEEDRFHDRIEAILKQIENNTKK